VGQALVAVDASAGLDHAEVEALAETLRSVSTDPNRLFSLGGRLRGDRSHASADAVQNVSTAANDKNVQDFPRVIAVDSVEPALGRYSTG
jgi:hypothetical protein